MENEKNKDQETEITPVPQDDAPAEENADTAAENEIDEFDFVLDGDEEPEEDAVTYDDDDDEDSAPKPRRSRVLGRLLGEERVLRYRYLGLAFLLPMFTMWLIYIAMGTFPFGDSSVLVLDLNGQYVYYFEQLREIVLGEGSFLYCFGRSLGGEFMGIFAYYLASPFSFLVCLFPKGLITEALLVMFLLKTGLCGLTFGIFLDYKTKKEKLNRTTVIIFSEIYALTAYAVVQQHNTMWIDNLIFLPLIVMGIERMIKYGRFRLFAISLTLAVMSNFYIGYMMCIFVFFYFFVCYATMDPEERNPMGEQSHFGKSLARMGGWSALVLMMSCVILWSAYYALTFGKTTFSNPTWTFDSKFDILDLISKLFIGSYDTVRPEGLPFIYCGSLVLILLPLYFVIKKIPFREKLMVGIMVIFFSLSFTVSAVDLVWHGFQRPNWLNYRYSFMLCFFMIFAAYRAFLYLKEIDIKTVILDVAFWVMVLVVLQKLDTYEWISDYGTVWLSFAFFAAYLILLRFHINSKLPEGVALAVASIVVLESFVGGLMNLLALGDDVVYSSRTSYRSFVDRVQPIVDMIQDDDDSFYRMEKTFHRKTNDSLALGFRGLSNSTSTLNADTIAFLANMGMAAKSHWTKYLGGTPVLDSLLGLKYIVIEEGENISPLYEKKYEYDHRAEGKLPMEAYYNPYALPIAFGVNGSLLTYHFEEGEGGARKQNDSPIESMNEIVGRMAGMDKDAKIFVPIKIDNSSYEYCTLGFTTGHQAYTNDANEQKGRVKYVFTATENAEVYCFFPSDYVRKCDLYLNGSKISTYYDNETYRVFDLGFYKKDEVVKVELRMTDNDKLYIKNIDTFFYYLDENAFRDAFATLSESKFEIESYTEDSFYGKINVEAGDELIFTSIPYDEGWVVKLDGKKVELVEVLDALIGFEATPGSHTLTMEYRPACVMYGSIISAVGVVIFVSLCVVDIRRRRKV